MRKKELEQRLESLQESVERQEVEAAISESAYLRKLAAEDKAGFWTSLDKSATKRNRSWNDVKSNLQECYSAWCVNPIAKSFCDYMRYFCIGRGTQITTDDGDDANDRINAFCELNDWAILEKKICEELSRDGEVFVRFHSTNRNEMEAPVAAVSLVDPLEIQAINCPEVDRPEWYLRKFDQLGEMSDEGVQSSKPASEQIDADDIIHLKINTSYNEIRGRSDLLVVLPWLRQLKRWLDDMSRRNYMIGSFVWDVLCKAGVKPSAVAARYPNGPMPGSVIAHSDNETWTPNAPKLNNSDSTEGARAIKLLVMAGFKHPESWYGDTGESNLSTTKALAMPTLRAFIDRQDTLKFYFEKVIQRGARVENITIDFPEIEPEEAKSKAEALAALSKAFLNLQDGGLVSRESLYKSLQQYMDTLDDWVSDESGPGEKAKLEQEEAEETVATSQGRGVAGEAGLLRPSLEEEGPPGDAQVRP